MSWLVSTHDAYVDSHNNISNSFDLNTSRVNYYERRVVTPESKGSNASCDRASSARFENADSHVHQAKGPSHHEIFDIKW